MNPPARGSGTKRGKPTTTRTLVLHHDDCLRHDPGLRHPERIDRAVAVLGALRDLGDCEFLPAPKATPEQLARVHGAEYPALLSEQEPAAGAGDRVALDPDTFLSPGSVDAALRGSGAACFAVDEVFAGRTHNAFCVTRPPGHHAEAATAMGFCLFNHAAVAARHALAQHGLERVAVVDFDVHHGNGTQAIFESSPQVFFASSHQMPLYPGTGAASETGCGNIHNLPLAPGDGGKAFRHAWSTRGLPALRAFQPELIIVSAGFDAHRADPLGQLELEDADFGWITEQLRAIAEDCCAGRLVSVLEGGYDLEALASAARAHVGVLTA